ncbi:MAG: MarR family transcriptional regulator [Terriglobia bacterium]|nr:MarR family transcriptional regulator [Terriglobia bacterium]
MNSRVAAQDPNKPLHQALAEFRRQLRKFLLASENAAFEAGLQPQQHQLLLAVAGAPAGRSPSIAYAADTLGLKHNSAVELVDRCEGEGLLERAEDSEDRRRVCLRITPRGRKLLDRLSHVHLLELNSQGPQLIESLENVLRNQHRQRKRTGRKQLG